MPAVKQVGATIYGMVGQHGVWSAATQAASGGSIAGFTQIFDAQKNVYEGKATKLTFPDGPGVLHSVTEIAVQKKVQAPNGTWSFVGPVITGTIELWEAGTGGSNVGDAAVTLSDGSVNELRQTVQGMAPGLPGAVNVQSTPA